MTSTRFSRLQRRISAAEPRSALETLARLRKQLTSEQVGPAISSPAKVGQAVPPGNASTQSNPPGAPPTTLSNHDNLSKIGFVSEVSLAASPEPAPASTGRLADR